jgi:tetratricopeptide (TPR) repeat protein
MQSKTHSIFVIALILVAMLSKMARGHIIPTPAVSKDEAMTMLLRPPQPSPLRSSIEKAQKALANQPQNPGHCFEQLGRLFISEARVMHQERGYQLADVCARMMDVESPQALLLRGHALLAMHRFHDAEEIARSLLLKRQEMVDHALLGDALMEQGRIDDSLPVYQSMIDAKPCLPSYSRIAHVRWLKGDVDGALDMMEQAVACGSYRDPEPMAWCTTRLAFFLWQKGDAEAAVTLANRAMEIVPSYPQALLIVGRVKLSNGDARGATDALALAAKQSPLPEILWALLDAQHAAGDESEATMAMIQSNGEAGDPRSFSLYLATRGADIEHALDLAKTEMQTRRDVFSWDALAWAQFASGEPEAALISVRKAMAEGTRDARLFLHAGLIARRANDPKADDWLAQARSVRALLLPSEQQILDRRQTGAAAETPRSSQPQVVNK